jgi:hypothetical protein
MKQAALELASAGWFVFPVQERGKQPLVRWRDESTSDADKVADWWDRWPNANIGIDCGKSRLVVVDYDGVEPPEVDTLQVKTGRGVHHYFYNPAEPVPNSASMLGDKIDVRGEGGYVLAPPSVHPSGAIYQWSENEIRPLPQLLRERMVRKKEEYHSDTVPTRLGGSWGEKILQSEAAIVRTTGEGKRNHQLFESALRVMSAVKGGHLDKEVAWSEMLNAAVGAGLDRDEADGTVLSAWERAGVRHPPDRPEHQRSAIQLPDDPAESWAPMGIQELIDLPPPKWLVPQMIVEGMNWLVGEQKIGKTFLALDAALTLARKAPVLYFAGEGVSGLGVRIQSWISYHAERPDSFMVFPFVPKLNRPGDPERFIATVESLQPKLVVIDTFARAMAGADENSAMEVGRFISMMDEARERSGCSSLILHHPAKNGLGYRGSGAIAGAADLLAVLSEDESVPGSLTLTYDDVKDFEEPAPRHFQLRRHDESAIIYPPVRMAGF